MEHDNVFHTRIPEGAEPIDGVSVAIGDFLVPSD